MNLTSLQAKKIKAYLFHLGIKTFLLLPLGRFVGVRFAETKSIANNMDERMQSFLIGNLSRKFKEKTEGF
jgi:hypothetical protein